MIVLRKNLPLWKIRAIVKNHGYESEANRRENATFLHRT